MRHSILFLAIFLSLSSCKNSDTTTTENSAPKLENGCYEYNKNNDLIKLQILENGDAVVGNLDFAYAEKDSNMGKFRGKVNGDKLIGVYTFLSEGIESTREIAFLIKDYELIEGYGEMKEEGQTFADTSKIQYTSAMPLLKVECK